MTNALVNTSIKNNMTNDNQIAYWQGTGTFSKISGSVNSASIKTFLDNVLSNTTVKRACCLGGLDPNNIKVNVRIPIPANYNTAGLPEINKTFGFIDKTVTVPSTFCNGLKIKDGTTATYKKNSPTNPTYNTACDDFFAVYCANMRANFNDEFASAYPGKPVDMEQFIKYYRPECACYAWDIPPEAKMYSPMGLGYSGCTTADNDAGNAYLDPASRDPSKKPSELVICSQLINLTGAQAGGGIHIDAKLTQNCGNKKTPTPTPTPLPTPTPTPPISTPTPNPVPTDTTSSATSLMGIPIYIWVILCVILILLFFGSSGYAAYASSK